MTTKTDGEIVEEFNEKCGKTFLHDGFLVLDYNPSLPSGHESWIDARYVREWLEKALTAARLDERNRIIKENLKGEYNRIVHMIRTDERIKLREVVESFKEQEHEGSCSINHWKCWDECCMIASDNSLLSRVLAKLAGEDVVKSNE